ncbi:hypothetical protein MRX96_004024 [Rhipicephalus microplus]
MAWVLTHSSETNVALLARVSFVMPSTRTLRWFTGSSRVDVRRRRRLLSGEGQALIFALSVFVLTGLHEYIVQGEARGSAQFVPRDESSERTGGNGSVVVSHDKRQEPEIPLLTPCSGRVRAEATRDTG